MDDLSSLPSFSGLSQGGISLSNLSGISLSNLNALLSRSDFSGSGEASASLLAKSMPWCGAACVIPFVLFASEL